MFVAMWNIEPDRTMHLHFAFKKPLQFQASITAFTINEGMILKNPNQSESFTPLLEELLFPSLEFLKAFSFSYLVFLSRLLKCVQMKTVIFR